MRSRGLYIGSDWQVGRGRELRSTDPATGEVVWQGRAAGVDDVRQAVAAARAATAAWSERTLEDRLEFIREFARLLERDTDVVAESISREIGKPFWESRAEVASMIAKIEISENAYRERCAERERETAGARAITRYRAHGVMAVFGPFNFPGHLPNGHIVPALIAGNTIVLKQSELAPSVGEHVARLWQESGLPPGVMNVLQGARETGEALARCEDIDGLLFTGGFETGTALARMLCERSGTLLALEMGGNNPLIVHEVGDLDAAAVITIQSAFASAGQRCTCARRLIVQTGAAGDAFVEQLVSRTARLRVGVWTDRPEPFMGPLVSAEAADRVLQAQAELRAGGGGTLLAANRPDPRRSLVTPGIIDTTAVADRPDEEIFGPLLQVIRYRDFDAALAEASATKYGLAAALLSDSRDCYERFRQFVRAGCVNWNRPTTGASSDMPFGGVGNSGNHRPSAYFAADYSAFPVASLEDDIVRPPAKTPPGIDS